MKDDLADFENFYRAHEGFVRQVLYRHLGATDLDDAVQECFLKIWKTRASFEGRARVRTWVYRIVTNHALDLLRARATRPTPASGEIEDLLAPPSRDVGLAEAVHASVAQLGDEFRVVVVGVIFEGMELAEVAEALAIPLGTVKSRLSRGRELIKTELKRRGYAHD